MEQVLTPPPRSATKNVGKPRIACNGIGEYIDGGQRKNTGRVWGGGAKGFITQGHISCRLFKKWNRIEERKSRESGLLQALKSAVGTKYSCQKYEGD